MGGGGWVKWGGIMEWGGWEVGKWGGWVELGGVGKLG